MKKRCSEIVFIVLAICGAVASQPPVWAQRVYMAYYPNVGYSSSQAYYQGDTITASGITYISLPPGPQTGNTPASSTTGYCLGYAVPCWQILGGGGGGGGTTTNALTFNNSGSGAASGTSFNGSLAQTLSWNSIGAQQQLTLTTTGTSGAATLSGGTLNIPQYSGGGVSLNPTTTQTLTQPSGTTLAVNSLNNVLYVNPASSTDLITQVNALFASCSYDCEVHIPAGNYTVTSGTININYPTESLTGDGANKVAITYAGTNFLDRRYAAAQYSFIASSVVSGFQLTCTNAAALCLSGGSMVNPVWRDIVVTGPGGPSNATSPGTSECFNFQNNYNWMERWKIQNVTCGGFSKNLHFMAPTGSGTSSYGYGLVSGMWTNQGAGTEGVVVDSGAQVYNTLGFNYQINSAGTTTADEYFHIAGVFSGENFWVTGENGGAPYTFAHIVGTGGLMIWHGDYNAFGSPTITVDTPQSADGNVPFQLLTTAGSLGRTAGIPTLSNYDGSGENFTVSPLDLLTISSNQFAARFGYLTSTTTNKSSIYLSYNAATKLCLFTRNPFGTEASLTSTWCIDGSGNTVQNGGETVNGALTVNTANVNINALTLTGTSTSGTHQAFNNTTTKNWIVGVQGSSQTNGGYYYFNDVTDTTVPLALASNGVVLPYLSPSTSALCYFGGIVTNTGCTGGSGGTITGVTAGSGLSGGGTSGNVTVSLTNNSTVVNGQACALGSSCTVSQFAALPSPSTVLADYQLNDGSGTAPADSSGNGNTGSFPGGSANPTWTTQGLSFTGGYPSTSTGQYFITAGTQNALTIMISYTMNAPGGNNGPADPLFYTLFCNTAISGLCFNSASQFYGYQPYLALNGAQRSTMSGSLVGTHTLVIVMGQSGSSITTTDQYYLDGQLQANIANGASAGLSTSIFNVGGSATGYSTYLYGQVYRATFWSTQLTAAQAAQASQLTTIFAQSKGVNYAPQSIGGITPQLVCTGDSLTNGNGVTPFCTSSDISTRITYNINNFGIGNISANVNASLMPFREQYYYSPLAQSNIAFIWNGTNDIVTYGRTAQQAMNAILIECNLQHKYGYKTIVATPISRATSGTSNDAADKDTLGPLIRQQAVSGGCDAVADFSGNPLVGADGAYSNSTYYQSDTTHLTATGQASVIAPMASHAIDQVTGSTANNCDPTVVTASTYTSVASDGCKVFNTASNSITDTLPSAIGYTGRVITRCNNSLSGSNTLTIASPSDAPFNNVSGTTTVTVPNNSCKQFKAMLISVTAAGEYWEQLN